MKIQKICLAAVVPLTAVLLLWKGGVIGAGVRTGIQLCGSVIIPSMFPFMMLSGFIARSGLLLSVSRLLEPVSMRLLRLPGCGMAVFLLSLIAGYPVGASLCGQMCADGLLQPEQAKRLCLYSCGAGPAFLVLAVGQGMLGSIRAGYLLLGAHLLAAVCTALLFARGTPVQTQPAALRRRQTGLPDAMVESVAAASSSMALICAFVLLFSGVVAILQSAGLPASVFCTVVSALEVSNGCVCLAQLDAALPCIAAAVGFGGFSVLCQILSVSKTARPRFRMLLLVRSVHAVCSLIFCQVFLWIFPSAQQAVQTGATVHRQVQVFSATPQFALALLLLCVVFLSAVYTRSTKRTVDFF